VLTAPAMANHDNSDLFVPIELEILFDSILKEVRPPELGPLEEARLRFALTRRLLLLYDSGVRDAANLRQRVLEYFPPIRWVAKQG
jgi:hypothetical protein